jgi:TolB-like protein/DNA-binding winged helix-turn-helix (wHTH) protein
LHGTSYKFGEFELDSAKFELRRADKPLKLERIPMDLLILLAEREGNVVSRREIIERLWGKDVFVDTEHGINVAVRKIRAALGDDADRPKFVQTVLGKGYRFVGEAASKDQATADLDRRADDPTEIGIPIEAPSGAGNWGAGIAALGGFVMFALAVVAFNVGGIADRMLASKPSTQIHSIAVIPLANLSGDASQDYYADGMTDEIITMLAKNSSLRVVSRTSAMQYKGAKRPLRDIARELGVDGILEGSVERSANRVHMTVQLIHAPSDSHIWAESYDRDFKDAFSIPEELSKTIAKTIRAAVPVTSADKPVNPEAHDAYLRGRYFWFANNNIRSIDELKKAIQIQPDYALAWAGLADAYLVQAVDDELPLKDVIEKADEAGRKAAKLDDSSAEIHNTMAGLYLFGHWDPKRANDEALRAIALNPKYAEIHHLRAYILEAMNRPGEALEEQRRCTELDRFARPWALGKVLTMQRKYDEAINEFKVLLEAQPEEKVGWFLLSDVYRLKGMMAEAAAAKAKGYRNYGLEKEAQSVERAFKTGGDRAVQDWELTRKKLLVGKEYVSPFDLASLSARSGKTQEALKYLEAAYEEHTPWIVLVQSEPDFDFIHGEERYRAIIKKVGLPPAY